MNPPTGRLPNFVFIGPDKTGSSWLHKALTLHPQVYVSPAKDTYFFDRFFGRGLEWYAKQFNGATDEPVVAEICHDYLFDPEVPGRLDESLGPDARLMVCLREPAERAVSAYLNLKKNGWDVGTLEDAIDKYPELVSNGRYGEHLEKYRSFVDTGRVYVASFADLQTDPQAFLDGVTEWLGIGRLVLADAERVPERSAAKARSAIAAKSAKALAGIARRLGWATAVGRVKNSPMVQRVLYKEYDVHPAILDSDSRDRLRSLFKDDVHHLDELLGSDYAKLWAYES